jgi:hypothetical protein
MDSCSHLADRVDTELQFQLLLLCVGRELGVQRNILTGKSKAIPVTGRGGL